jgi:hypothetical protein
LSRFVLAGRRCLRATDSALGPRAPSHCRRGGAHRRGPKARFVLLSPRFAFRFAQQRRGWVWLGGDPTDLYISSRHNRQSDSPYIDFRLEWQQQSRQWRQRATWAVASVSQHAQRQQRTFRTRLLGACVDVQRLLWLLVVLLAVCGCFLLLKFGSVTFSDQSSLFLVRASCTRARSLARLSSFPRDGADDAARPRRTAARGG